jgi:acyl-[acyl-carrier-protein]-phospholipid O-acyltransferase/long-chain-fatty-acid--[acyl-carrier-protein] ligase
MILHQQFVRIAKQNEKKLAVIDRTLDRRLTYKRALIGSLLLVRKFEKYDPGFLGIMLPNSVGSVLAILGTLMSGRVPVMINYSTGAAANCEYAKRHCAFKTIITSRALCQKINCPHVEGMVYLEDIMKTVSVFDKIKAALKAGQSTEGLLRSIHQGDENDTLLILFTTGSEKDPKAVQLTHRNISANYESLKKAFDLNGSDIFLANLPYFHVFGQTANLWVPLLEGMTLVTYANPLFGIRRPGTTRRYASCSAAPTSAPRPCASAFCRSTGRPCSRLMAPPRPARASRSTPCPTTAPAAWAGRWRTSRSGSSTTRPAKPARWGRSARSWSRATT